MINVRPSVPAFRAYKSGTQVVGRRAWIQITSIDTVDFDTSSSFTSDAYTPPAGYYCLVGWFLLPSGMTNYTHCEIALYKNGTIAFQSSCNEENDTGGHGRILVHDYANGSDAYTLYTWMEHSSANATYQGGGMFGYRFAT